MKYINIKKFITLTKTFSNAETITYLSINLIQNSIRVFSLKKLCKFLHFYSQRQIKNTLKKLMKENYISLIECGRYHTNIKFGDLTKSSNNRIAISNEIINKYQKHSILFYKYKIFELFCDDLLVKQDRLKKLLNISQYELYQFKQIFKMDIEKLSLKLKGFVKWQLGLEDRNIKNSNYWYSSLPNRYIFYPNTKKILIKANNKFVNKVRNFLVFNNFSKNDSCCVGIKQKVASTTKLNVNSQLSFLYTQIIENTSKYRYKIEKQLNELFPYFVKRNNKRYYKYNLHQLI